MKLRQLLEELSSSGTDIWVVELKKRGGDAIELYRMEGTFFLTELGTNLLGAVTSRTMI